MLPPPSQIIGGASPPPPPPLHTPMIFIPITNAFVIIIKNGHVRGKCFDTDQTKTDFLVIFYYFKSHILVEIDCHSTKYYTIQITVHYKISKNIN